MAREIVRVELAGRPGSGCAPAPASERRGLLMATVMSASWENRPDQGDLWRKAQAVLKTRMSQPSFETWISPLTLADITPKTVTLQAESDFNRDLILQRYRKELKDAFSV